MNSPTEILRTVFGYHSFQGPQEEIIEHVIAGNDALVLMPTGGGKSLCYQIPAIIRNGVGIVISPLIALMQDQVEQLSQLGVKAAFLNSSLNPRQTADIETHLLSNKLDLLYIAPERLLMPRFLVLLEKIKVSIFAIDEAHCVSQWGHDFRPHYAELNILHQQFSCVPRIALTATADAPTRKDIIHDLSLNNARQFISSFDRPNLQYRVTYKSNPRQQLLDFLSDQKGNAGIIYCLSRKKVEETSVWLNEKGWEALPYHAGLPSKVREQNQKRFIREEGLIIIATVAFGMGINKPNVRFVAHLDLPKSLEAYYQETGRAGRDGLPAWVWACYGVSDVVILRQMIDNSVANQERKQLERRKLDALIGFAETTVCRRQVLLNYFGEEFQTFCQSCDNCLTPAISWDGKTAAQMALSCVYRTGQRFGVKHVIDILVGKLTEQVKKFRHEKLSTFGIGQMHSTNEWRSIFRQLIASNILLVDLNQFGCLRFTSKSKKILLGEEGISFRKDVSVKGKSEKKISTKMMLPEGTDSLWQALKKKRLELAREQGVPPYVIFHDKTLHEIYEKKPHSLTEFALINGVGQSKLARYGHSFIKIILLQH